MIHFLFATIATLIIIGMNYYAYTRFLKKAISFKKLQKTLKWLMISVISLEILFFATLNFGSLNPKVFLVVAALIGISFMLFCVAIVYDLVQIPLAKFAYDASRRRVLKGIVDVTMLMLAFTYIFKGFVGGAKKPELKIQPVLLKGLKEPLSIIQITDVHVGKTIGKKFVEKMVEAINLADSDLVVITGDLVDLDASRIGNKLNALADIKSRYGVYFVPGNHEYFHGIEGILELLEGLNIKVLGNSHVKVGGINLAGVYDLVADRMEHHLKPDIKMALKGVDEGLPTVLLAHQPKYIKYLKESMSVDLVISGHTHAGQIFPFGFLVLLDQPYLYGLYKHSDKTQIYVSSGVGYWGPPLRINAPSEIVKFKLRPAQ